MEPQSLLQHLKPPPRQRYDCAIVATFGADLRFFEQHVFPNLRAQRVLCLMDAGHFQQLTQGEATQAARFAGIRYQVAPVSAPGGVFHPKFIVCLSEKRFRLFLGSHNLTQAGYLSNAELFTCVEGESESADEATALVNDLCDFLEALTQGPYLTSPAQKFIQNALTLRPSVSQLPERRYKIVSSISQPILDAIETQLAGQPVTEVYALSPFWGHDARLLDELARRFHQPKFKIYVQSGRAVFDRVEMQTWHAQYGKAQLFRVQSASKSMVGNATNGERYIHAKLLALVTAQSTLFLTGSPNFTRTALAMSANSRGNIETGLLEHRPDVANIEHLLHDGLLQTQAVDSWASLESDTTSDWPRVGQRPLLQVVEARYAAPHLTIEIIYPSGRVEQLTNGKVMWCRPGGPPSSSTTIERLATGRWSVNCELTTVATLVWMEMTDPTLKQVLRSERQWITFPQLPVSSDGAFGADDFDQCVDIGGLAGVQEALKLASANAEDQPDWLIQFLQNWDLGAILSPQAQHGARPHPLHLAGDDRGLALVPNLNVLNRNLTHLTHPDTEALRQAVVERYRQRVVEWLEQGQEGSELQVGLQYAAVFNVLCLLLMAGFHNSILLEREKKAAGRVYPEMQYGHMRIEAKSFIEYFEMDWEKHWQLGNRVLGRLSPRRADARPHLLMFHWAQTIMAYNLLGRISSQLDLEAPITFRPIEKVCANIIGEIARDEIRQQLAKDDKGDEQLTSVMAVYDLVLQMSQLNFSPIQIRATLDKLSKPDNQRR